MKNILILLMLVAVACGSAETNEIKTEAQKAYPKAVRDDSPAESPDIKVSVNGLNGGMVKLIGVFTDQHYVADSAMADNNGFFNFKREQPYKAGFYFAYLPNKSSIQMLIDKDQTFEMETTYDNLADDMKVTGNIETELLFENLKFENQQRPIYTRIASQMKRVEKDGEEYNKLKAEQQELVDERQKHLDAIYEKYPNTFFVSFKRAGQNPDVPDFRKADGTKDVARQVHVYKKEFWEGVDFSDERLMRTPVISNKLKRYMDELTAQNKDTILSSAFYLVDKVLDYPDYFQYFANWITLKYEPTKSKVMGGDAVYTRMIQRYFTQERAFWSDSIEIYRLQSKADEMQASLLGEKGPDVKTMDNFGKMRSIYEIKAPYIIVYMYNPDCEHCEVETPKLVDYYRKKKPEIEVFAIAVDTDDAQWKAYIKKNGMNWIHVHDPTNRSIYKKYYVDITPEIYVLNPDRIIVGKNIKVNQIEEIINRDKQKR